MSARTRVSRSANVLLTLLFLPGRIVEELLHAVGALPFAEWIRVEVDPQQGTAHTRIRFREHTPDIAIRFAYALPEIVASLAGVAVIAYWLVAGPIWLPATTLDWLLLCLFGAQWLAIALPSAADLDHSPEAAP